jgi:hypothetical protein
MSIASRKSNGNTASSGTLPTQISTSLVKQSSKKSISAILKSQLSSSKSLSAIASIVGKSKKKSKFQRTKENNVGYLEGICMLLI